MATPSGRWVDGRATDHLTRDPGYVLGGEPELGLDVLEGRRLAEGGHPHDGTLPPHVTLPAERRALLDREARSDLGWEDLVAVLLVLLLEDLPAGQADDAAADAV